MSRELTNKHIVIFGSSRGIGKTIAESFAEHGANLTLVARSENSLLQIKNALSLQYPKQKIEYLCCDVASKNEVAKTIQRAQQTGPIYGLVCASAIYGPIGPLETNSLLEWEQAIQINVLGTIYAIHAALPQMKQQGDGRIILFSGGGQNAIENFSAYVASKGAIWRLTESLGKELASSNIFLNAIAPGAVNTQFLEDLLAAGPQKVGAELYNKSLEQKKNGGANPTKAADLCLYLMSEKSHGLYGKTISALWDDYRQFSDLASISQSELYTFKRIVK